MVSIDKYYDYLPDHIKSDISLNIKTNNLDLFTKIFNRKIDDDQYLRYNTKRIQNKYDGETGVTDKNFDNHQEIWHLLTFSGKTGNIKYVNDLKEILIPKIFHNYYDQDVYLAVGATEAGDLDLVKEMVSKIKSNKNTFNIDKKSDLNMIMISAVKYNQPEIFEYMIKNGAGGHSAYTMALINAAKNGNLEMVKLISEKVDNRVGTGDAILAAAENGHLEVIVFLTPQINLSLAEEVMLTAGKKGHLDIVDLMIQNGAHDYISLFKVLDPNLVNQVVQMIFQDDPKYRDVELMEYAIKNPDLFSYDHYKLLIKDPENLNYLIQIAKDYNNQKALRVLNVFENVNNEILMAIKSGKLKTLKDLIPKSKGIYYNSAAELAASLDNLDAFNVLLENVPKDEINYNELLIKLVGMGQLEAIDLLIEKEDFDYRTAEYAILEAAKSGTPNADEVIQTLSPLLDWDNPYGKPLKPDLKALYRIDKIDQAQLIMSNLNQDKIISMYALKFEDYPFFNSILKNLKFKNQDEYNDHLRELIKMHPFIFNENKENLKNFNSLLKSAKTILDKDDLNDILRDAASNGNPTVVREMIKLGADDFQSILDKNLYFPDNKRDKYAEMFKLILDKLGYKKKDYSKLMLDYAKSRDLNNMKLLLTLGVDDSSSKSLFELLDFYQISDLQKNNYINWKEKV